MNRRNKLVATIVMTVASFAPLAIAGCAAHTRYYDDYYSDYHYWNAHEEHAYRMWLAERHYEYREFSRLSHEQQREYWAWRHNHPDAGR